MCNCIEHICLNQEKNKINNSLTQPSVPPPPHTHRNPLTPFTQPSAPLLPLPGPSNYLHSALWRPPVHFHTTSTQPFHELVIPTLVPYTLPRWTSSTQIKGAKKKLRSEKRANLLELTEQRLSTRHTKILHIFYLQNQARIVQILCIICPDNIPPGQFNLRAAAPAL